LFAQAADPHRLALPQRLDRPDEVDGHRLRRRPSLLFQAEQVLSAYASELALGVELAAGV
jgi:hypothetical protein